MGAIRDACWREEALCIHYVDRSQVANERTVLPLAIICTDRVLTVLARCCWRQAVRLFQTDRIVHLQLAGTSFRSQPAVLLREYLVELRRRTASVVDAPMTP